MSRQVLIQLNSLILLFVLIYTGLSKWINFTSYTHSMYSQPIPVGFTDILIYLVPIIEILAATLLVFNSTRQLGLWITTFLMLSFTGYVLYIRFSALYYTTCPCGGLFSKLNWKQHIWVNSLLTIMAIGTALLNRKIFPGHGKGRNADASIQTK